MKRALLAAALLLPAVAHSQQAVDAALLATAVGGLAVDWGQTRYISRFIAAHPGCRCYETNPLLGRSPSTARVNAYFATAIIGTVGLSLVLPQKQRRWFLLGVTAVETTVIIRNNSLGVQIAY